MRVLFLLLGFVAASPAMAAGDLVVDKVWMRESVPGQTAATVQLNLTVVPAATLTGVSSPRAQHGQLLRVLRRPGKMVRQSLASVKLAPHSTTRFGEEGLYLMLTGIQQPLNVGERVPVVLQLKVGGKTREIKTEAEVRALELSYRHYNDPAVMDHQ